MRVVKYLLIIAVSVLMSAFVLYTAVSWEIKDGYVIEFESSNPSGSFTGFNGDITFDPDNLSESKFDLKVDVKSINTGIKLKNKHARGEKWLNAEKYPEITFVSSKIVKAGKGYEVTGKMFIHGVSKEMTIPFSFNDNTFSSEFEINRLEFNVGNTKGMSSVVPEVLKIKVSVPVLRK